MKTINRVCRVFRAQGVLPVCLVAMLVMSLLLLHCKKQEKVEDVTANVLQEFVHSSLYKDYLSKNASLAATVDPTRGRIVQLNRSLCSIHIPIVEDQQIKGVIVALPNGKKGRYELIYQDNTAALSGTGLIRVRTAANEPFCMIRLDKGKITTIEPVYRSGESASRMADPAGCGFLCQLSKCYTTLKANFPTDAVCALLDILMGVCTVATVTSCLIKMTS